MSYNIKNSPIWNTAKDMAKAHAQIIAEIFHSAAADIKAAATEKEAAPAAAAAAAGQRLGSLKTKKPPAVGPQGAAGATQQNAQRENDMKLFMQQSAAKSATPVAKQGVRYLTAGSVGALVQARIRLTMEQRRLAGLAQQMAPVMYCPIWACWRWCNAAKLTDTDIPRLVIEKAPANPEAAAANPDRPRVTLSAPKDPTTLEQARRVTLVSSSAAEPEDTDEDEEF